MVERVKLKVERRTYEWMEEPTPIPVSHVIKPFVDPKNEGRGLTLKDIVLYGTSNKHMPSPRKVLAFNKTLEKLCGEELLRFVPMVDRYFLSTSIDVAAVRASIRVREERLKAEAQEALTTEIEGAARS